MHYSFVLRGVLLVLCPLCISSIPEVLIEIFKKRLNIDQGLTKFPLTAEGITAVVEKASSPEVKTCVRDIRTVIDAATAGQKWAIQMFDSYGKYVFHTIWPGKSFCQNLIPYLNAENKSVTFRAEFCNLQIANTIRLGICLPDSCRQRQVNDLLQHFSVYLRCTNPSEPFWSSGYVLFCLFLCFVLVALAVAGTVYETILRLSINKELQRKSTQFQYSSKQRNGCSKINGVQQHETPVDLQWSLKDKILNEKVQHDGWLGTILISFSFYTNGIKVLNIKARKSQLHCVHGLRVISIIIIVYGHCFARKLYAGDNIPQATNIIEKFPIYLLLNGASFVVDTFLILSGLLLSYVYFGKGIKIKKISWLSFYLHRIIRLTPSYWFTVLILNFGLFIREGIGPLNLLKMNEEVLCKKSWWKAIFYVTNFGSGEQCSSTDWYLSIDMQFYILSPIFLYLLRRSRNLSLKVFTAVILATSITNWIIANKYRNIVSIPRDIMEALEMLKNYLPAFDHLYKKPYCRITSFLMGMMAGFILEKQKCIITFTKFQAFILWCIAMFGCISAVMIPYWFFIANETAALYYTIKYILWSSGIISLIFLCVSGYGGFINSFLSWPGWIPFSRLSYGVYLLERTMSYYLYSQIEKPLHFEFPETHLQFLGLLVMTYVAALFLYLMVENPLYLILVKLLQPKQ